MKTAVIADVHGNAPALKAVLKSIDGQKDIDHIYCAGDMIGIGPDSNEVLRLLFSRTDVSMVTGNHDEAVLALLTGAEYPKSHAETKLHHQWIAKHLDPSFIPLLKGLPRTHRQTINGCTLLLTHYHIKPDRLLDPIGEDPFSGIIEPSMDNMVSLFADVSADIILFGHHHPLHYFKNDLACYVNPGSLRCSQKAAARYAVIDFTKKPFSIQFEEVSYDKTTFLASYEKLQVPDRNFILSVFHGAVT